MSRDCPALLVSAPASGQGKTTFCAALARYHRRQGRRVCVFKTGPDFLDPMILERASGAPVYQLDLWMVGEADCRRLLYEAAADSDLILIEGVMGLYDGVPSSADLARTFGVPIVALIDAGAMAQTFGAVAQGLASYARDAAFAGVIANGVGGTGHTDLLRTSLPDGVPFLGSVPRLDQVVLPSRHLGLVQATELIDLDERLDAAADSIAHTALRELPVAVSFQSSEVQATANTALQGCTIAVARDAAFSFIYEANLDCLEDLGAQLVFFSPLEDTVLPACDAIWLPGGYPELHMERLMANEAMCEAVRQHVTDNKPLFAECGGMLYLLDELVDAEGCRQPMLGVLPGEAVLEPNLVGIGLQRIPLPDGDLRGHSFHHTRADIRVPSATRAIHYPDGRPGECVYHRGRLSASYLHAYFASNPAAVATLFAPE
ncbi:MAG: cobyrinate a,c-diamide synthase [Pseudomonadota bacterium]|nr:cobyrinate a,c-diamide synthase [Pseudomonadota bacterium]